MDVNALVDSDPVHVAQIFALSSTTIQYQENRQG